MIISGLSTLIFRDDESLNRHTNMDAVHLISAHRASSWKAHMEDESHNKRAWNNSNNWGIFLLPQHIIDLMPSVCIYIKRSSRRRNFGSQTLIASVDVKQHDTSTTSSSLSRAAGRTEGKQLQRHFGNTSLSSTASSCSLHLTSTPQSRGSAGEWTLRSIYVSMMLTRWLCADVTPRAAGSRTQPAEVCRRREQNLWTQRFQICIQK